MLDTISYYQDFNSLIKNEPGKIVAYGLGNNFEKYKNKLSRIDYLCDARAADINEIDGMKVYTPKELEKIGECLYIVVFIADDSIYQGVVSNLNKLDITGRITRIFDNRSFGFSFPKYRKNVNDEKKLKINIVCRIDGWIFTKFAKKMKEYLEKEDVDVTISDAPKKDVDLNHHIAYLSFDPYINDTLMITHVDSAWKVDRLREQLETARVGICMSRDTRNKLISYGIPAYKLCYINPAQDNMIRPQKYHIGITHRCYDELDVRKRAGALLDIVEGIKADYFKFSIMGAGWEVIVAELKRRGFEVDYYSEFDYMAYTQIMNEIDYYLYTGFDEGSMGYLDALRAGTGTIVTPQGFHLDVNSQIDYPCSTVEQFHNAFLKLQHKRDKKIDSVKEWSWENYVKKHLQLWKYILKREDMKKLYSNQLCYEDGIFSLLMEDVSV